MRAATRQLPADAVKLCVSHLMVFPRFRALSRVGFRSNMRAVPATEVATAAPGLAGRWVQASHSNRHGARAYRIYIPERDEGRPRPLVVMLHGCKQNPDDFAAGTRMNQLADELGFIVAYP